MRCGVRFRFSGAGRQLGAACPGAPAPERRPPGHQLMRDVFTGWSQAARWAATGRPDLELKVAVIDPVQDRARRCGAFKRALDKDGIAKCCGLIFGIIPDLP
ncbi:hypothetical protein Amn_21450 [Aminobacter sp. Y103A]|nr:hypothetical protein Amn_21450 [Aminobacter sp. SS-2016]